MNDRRGTAIIGLSGRFPKAETMDEFWDVLAGTQAATSPVPAERKEVAKWADKYKIYGGFLRNVARFDAPFFDITAEEAIAMDPQQRLFLQIAWHAIENAGYTPRTLPRRTGVFVGAISADYATLAEPHAFDGGLSTRATDRYQIANRVSYQFDFTGPSMTIDTACSGSGVAIHTAIHALEYGDCDVAIVGGVNLFLHASRFAQFRERGILSDDNICRPFRDGANGAVYGEGVGALVLRPAKAAHEAGDLIRAYVAGSAVNSAGQTPAFTVPNSRSQTDVMQTALAQAKLSVADIDAVEAHGTGTALGDPIEARGIADVFRKAGIDATANPVKVGTLKGHFGHMESAAAIAAVTKVVAQMEHEQLVPTLPDLPQSRLVSFKRTPLSLQNSLSDWPLRSGASHRCVLINSIGGGGVNASLVLTEGPKSVPQTTAPYGDLFIFSARNTEQLRDNVTAVADWLEKQLAAPDMHRIATTLQIGREAFAQRVVFLALDRGELLDQMRAYLAGDIASSDLPQMAIDWVSGKDVDWTAGRSRVELPYILPLPGYQFGGEDYWLAEKVKVKALEPAI
ncbi:MAG: beta-ketoacyl synthase N-terminal-like domain-containing protein [Sulfitobacter sp.]